MVGCSGSHPLDRPVIGDCSAAFEIGQQNDPCSFAGECATTDGSTRRGAVCANGLLLTGGISERIEAGSGACPGEWHGESDANVSFVATSTGCVEVTFCNELPGSGETTLRIARLCQTNPTTVPPEGAPHTDCVEAVRAGADGDACAGELGCIANREITTERVLPIVGWCDAGVLRLAPSQTLIHGVP